MSNKSEQFKFKLEKIIGIQQHAGKVRKLFKCNLMPHWVCTVLFRANKRDFFQYSFRTKLNGTTYFDSIQTVHFQCSLNIFYFCCMKNALSDLRVGYIWLYSKIINCLFLLASYEDLLGKLDTYKVAVDLLKQTWNSASQFQVCFKTGIQINLDLKSLIPGLNRYLKS